MFPEGRAVEFLVVAIVALIVVGPKDLPMLLRKFGQFMAKVRAMASEFRASFDEMARQSELDELRKEVEAMRQGQLVDMATHAPEVNQAFDDISQGLSDVGVQMDAAMAAPFAGAQTSHVEIEEAPRAKPRKTGAKKPLAKKAAAKTATPTVTPRKPQPKPKSAAKAGSKAAKTKPPVRKATVS